MLNFREIEWIKYIMIYIEKYEVIRDPPTRN